MSMWTHITGAIRVDRYSLCENEKRKKLNELIKILGNTCNYDSNDEVWDRCNVPLGSEGSIQYHIHEYDKGNGLPWAIVSIWGDLRDTSNIKEIVEWVRKICEDPRMIIRQVSLDIFNKDSPIEGCMIRYSHNTNKIIINEYNDNNMDSDILQKPVDKV